MRLSRRRFLRASAVLVPAVGFWPIGALGEKEAGEFDFSGNVIPAPNDPAQWPAFRAALDRWRKDTKARLHYSDALYRKKEFVWAASNYSCCFLMLCDEAFYDPKTARYQVDPFLESGEREFGGYDSVVLWHAYPRIGIDERNQFDFYRDMPGGLEGLRDVVRQFHRRGVKVYIDYNPWDTGTRREGEPDSDALVKLVQAMEVDGIFLDTMSEAGAGLRGKLDAVRPGVILEGEDAVPLEHVHDHHASWAQWFADSEVPGVLQHKSLERRHMQHQIRRWDIDHSAELQLAWMNGSGMMVWENVFGSWIPWNERDRSILRAMLAIQRRFTSLFSGENWVPLVPTDKAGVYASLWEGNGLRLWTLVNRTENQVEGDLLQVAGQHGDEYFDLIKGDKASCKDHGRTVGLSGRLPPRSIGCFLAGTPKELGGSFKQFLKSQAGLNARSSSSLARPSPQTQLVRPRPANPKDAVPNGMQQIPAANLELNIEMRVRECGFYESMPKGDELGDSYPFKTRLFRRQVEFSRFAMDETLVSNAEYLQFLEGSGYKPKQTKNFLKHWEGGRPPAGKEEHPVVYVDLDDARAYARWVGKRLPTEEEWQYAAQGKVARKYPWGDQLESGRCNDGAAGGTTPTKAFPSGRSPFGCFDMCGNVWQWTESERTDGHTRFCILRGGSFFAAQGSGWYADGGPRPTNFAEKFLMMWPGLDRCSTIGFRCSVDLKAI
jgi:formylglycine-generating enzyme required for sulfatase activity